jgi:ADP-dependent NAD(P)H-hydrate dehydratase / NAD(P)H-hydrate epimerase
LKKAMILVTAAEMKEMDRRTIEDFGLPGRILMENAGRGAAEFFIERYPETGTNIGILAGRGNNGGDGFVIARYLAQRGRKTSVYLLSSRRKVEGDAAENLKLLPSLGIPVHEIPDSAAFAALHPDLARQDILVDAVLGTGLRSKVAGLFKQAIGFMNDSGKPVFAVDIPSGLDPDTGLPLGACVSADATATFGFAKLGLFLLPGPLYAGKLKIVDIGIPPFVAEAVNPLQRLLSWEVIRPYFPFRSPDIHKGRTGHVLILAASPGKTGAAAMAAEAALRAGAGLATLGIPKHLNPVLETMTLEAMTVPLPETAGGFLDESGFETVVSLLPGKNCLALGPGLGTEGATGRLVRRLIEESSVPLVIDADGINLVAETPEILKKARVPVILTPHPGEMGKLARISAGTVQRDRIGFARRFALEFGVHLILKGAGTVVAHPDGSIYLNPTGNPGMASGGMGDVLTGIVSGLLAQGLSAEYAARSAVFLHGAAADALTRTGGPFGYLASEVSSALPRQIARWGEKG